MTTVNIEKFGKPVPRSSKKPAHTLVKERIVSLIKTGDLKPGDKLPPEPDLAEAMGVSRMTANKSLLALVSEGYLEREKGRGTFVCDLTQVAKSNKFAIVIKEAVTAAVENYYFGTLFTSIQDEGSQHQIQFETLRLTEDFESEVKNRGIAGSIFINPPTQMHEMIEQLGQKNGPIVILGASWDILNIPCIDSDNILGAALAINHLADLGHKRIAMVAAVPDDTNTQDRIRGYQVAMKIRGLTAREEDIIISPSALRLAGNSQEELEKLLTSENRPTAIFAGGPSIAMLIIGVAQKLNLVVPEDLSIVGYDDPIYMSLSYPPLTTVKQPLDKMARRACDVMWELHTGIKPEKKIIIDPELVIRRSTAEAPKI